MLPGLSAVSAVSGGSLVAGLLGTRWERLEFQNGVATHFPEEVAGPTLSFCGVNVDVKSIILGLLKKVCLVGELTDVLECPQMRT